MTVPRLPAELEEILAKSFYIRTTLTRKNGKPRTVETTYVWLREGGVNKLILSGYPGKRDWVASMARNPVVTVHTVESPPWLDDGSAGQETGPWFDIPAEAKVIRDLDEKLPKVFAFIERWALRPNFPRTKFNFLLGAVKVNRRLRLPWWGPFILAKRIFNGMPCVELTFTGEPVLRTTGGPPPLSEPQEGRPF